jgi:hypothetical protein
MLRVSTESHWILRCAQNDNLKEQRTNPHFFLTFRTPALSTLGYERWLRRTARFKQGREFFSQADTRTNEA